MRSQKRMTFFTASTTSGLSKLRSGWWLKKRCQKNCCATGSHVQLDVSVSVKMIRVPAYLFGSSLHTYQSRSGEPLGARRAR
jgi:hypothetical protein